MANLISRKLNLVLPDRFSFIIDHGKGQQDMLSGSLTAEVPILYLHFYGTCRIYTHM